MLPLNFTKEIIDEISILYRDAPIYKVKSKKTGKVLKRDQKIWEDVMKHSRYLATMDRLDHWCHLLGTVLVKVGFIDENTGQMVKETDGGSVQLTLLHGGVYDTNYHDSPYHISELLIGFGQGFSGFNRGNGAIGGKSMLTGIGKSAVGGGGAGGAHGQISTIYWSPDSHKVGATDADGKTSETAMDNPYGLVPAVPFFNSDPAHYYFLPVNEPLLYANHALNMRMTDLNHIAKFQSFGVPVLSGVERGTSIRRGRPQDDHNFLRGGSVARGNGGGGGIASGSGSGFRTFDNAFGFFNDGNADANAVGMSIGPDTAISVGEKGDFKFAHPNSDITGLTATIQSIQDWVRINHGLQPKGSSEASTGDASGFSKMLSKIGVLEENIKRQKLFMEREQQLFQVIKKLWNIHHEEGSKQFDDDAYLEITYVEPQFPVDPLTKINLLEGQRKIIESGDRRAINEMFKHMDEDQINEMINRFHKDRKEQIERELEIIQMQSEKMEELGLDYNAQNNDNRGSSAMVKAKGADKSVSKLDNKAKHSNDSSKQKGKNLDSRKQPKQVRKEKPQGKTKGRPEE